MNKKKGPPHAWHENYRNIRFLEKIKENKQKIYSHLNIYENMKKIGKKAKYEKR